eukprot:TRINITY_DN3683_c0_g1_i2.p1 TRINITY_DN3683_c0_g1~~TRINITY_DN3683_c0_g1_i2.p1  ORF type:complete len:602 (-),score=193.68 TRINITY_DN3683_c0_g1_i2:74-1852(-)
MHLSYTIVLLVVVAAAGSSAAAPHRPSSLLLERLSTSAAANNPDTFMRQVLALQPIIAQHADLASWEGPREEDGGDCLACVLVLTVLDMNIDEDAEILEKVLVGLCTLIDAPLRRNLCERVVSEYGVDLIKAVLDRDGPNRVCQKLALCDTCSLALPEALESRREEVEASARRIGWALDRSLLSSEQRERFPSASANANANANAKADADLPRQDEDSDRFSATQLSYRGAMWRGRDCNDLAPAIHPGLEDDVSGLVDNNCNGIYGLNPSTNKPYEREMCDGTSVRMLTVYGDSASAGFHIPPEWLHFQNLSAVPQEAIDEFDVPEKSWGTGFVDTINNASIALMLDERNHCNHRGFENLARNGAKMKDLAPQSQNMGTTDYPTLGFVAYIGNDVCTSALDKMTTPEAYENYLLEGLDALDKVLNPGSKIVLTGLADGSVLWDIMHNRTHPLGCTYAALYEFLSCTGSNPCNTWLTSDADTRIKATQRAAELSAVGEATVEHTLATKNYTNFDLRFVGYAELMDGIINEVESNGNDPSSLIEAVDGFHPSQYAHRITSHVMFQIMLRKYPEYVGPVNSNNGAISRVFGQQGGF